jgi:serine/threonine protein phosphatase PrpC
MKSIVFSHKGKRKDNQDYILVNEIKPGSFLYFIADGMGGYEHGDVAAKKVSESVSTYLSKVEKLDAIEVQNAINQANVTVNQLKDKYDSKVGATVGGVLLHSNQAFCFWVGDVKIFHFKKNELAKESESHTLINEVKKNGSIKDPDQINKYRHVVTRSVQGNIELSLIDSFIIDKFDSSDLILICSDGVHDLYDSLSLQYILKNSNSIEDSITKIEIDLLEQSKDNFSLISIQL